MNVPLKKFEWFQNSHLCVKVLLNAFGKMKCPISIYLVFVKFNDFCHIRFEAKTTDKI